MEARSFNVPSRTLPGLTYRVDVAIDGTLVCSCPAASNNLVCWHIKYVKEELDMTEETTTALVPVKLAPTRELVPSEHTLALIDRTAQLALAGAIALPKELNTREKVAAVMLYGLELGLKPMTALRHIYIVNGRPSPSAEVMAGLLISSEPDARLIVEELTDQTCTMRIVRPQRNLDERYTVTWAEIEKAGLAKSDMNSKYPRDRLRWHCTKRLLRIYAPDAINSLDAVLPGEGLMAEMEVSDAELYNEGDEHTIEGEVINGAAQQGENGAAGLVPSQATEVTPPAASPPAPVDLLNAIKDKHGAMAAGEARACMPYLYGTGDLLRLNDAQRQDYAAKLRVRLEEPEHAHVAQYTAETPPRCICERCGAEADENAPLKDQPALIKR